MKNSQTYRFSLIFTAGFALALATSAVFLFALARIALNDFEKPLPSFPNVPKEIRGRAKEAAFAKLRQEWWLGLASRADIGVSINALREPELIGEIFPGYPPEMVEQKSMWSQYFSQTFNTDTRLLSLQSENDLTLSMSWPGCLLPFDRYGGDTLILGNSETARSIHPAYLQTLAPFQGQKVLACTRSSMLPNAIVSTLEHAGKKKDIPIERVIIGYSLWWAYPEEPAKRELAAAQKKEWQFFLKSINDQWQNLLSSSGLATGLSWDDVFSLTWDRMRSRIARTIRKPPPPGTLNQGPFEKNVRLNRTDLPLLGSENFKPLPYYRMVEGGKPVECHRLDVARVELRSMIHAAVQVAKRVYVYLAPITPMGLETYDPCFMKFAQEELPKHENARVKVLTGDWKSYGLSWSDFVLPTEHTDTLQTDINHTNYQGSRRVTEHLARWIERNELR